MEPGRELCSRSFKCGSSCIKGGKIEEMQMAHPCARAPTEEEGKKDQGPTRTAARRVGRHMGRRPPPSFLPSVRPSRSTAPPPPAREPPEMMRGVCPRAPLHGSYGMHDNPDPAGCGSSSSRGRTQNNSMEGGRGVVTTVVQYVIRMRYLHVQNLLLTSPLLSP